MGKSKKKAEVEVFVDDFVDVELADLEPVDEVSEEAPPMRANRRLTRRHGPHIPSSPRPRRKPNFAYPEPPAVSDEEKQKADSDHAKAVASSRGVKGGERPPMKFGSVDG